MEPRDAVNERVKQSHRFSIKGELHWLLARRQSLVAHHGMLFTVTLHDAQLPLLWL